MRIAVIGLGFMGSTHVKAWSTLPGAELLAVVSADEKKLAGALSGIKGNLGGPGEKMDFSQIRKYRTVEAALLHPGFKAVDILFPTYLHPTVRLGALASAKHIHVQQ